VIEPRFGRALALLVPIAVLALRLTACAGPSSTASPSPAAPADAPKTGSAPLPEAAAFVREIDKMIASGDVERAERVVHEEKEKGTKGASAAEVRLAQGEVDRARGALDAAAVAYAGVESATGGAALAGVAWQRIAAIHGARKEPQEELRALLKSRDLLDPSARSGVDSRISAIVGSLTPAERAAWARAFPGASLVSRDARARSGHALRVVLLAPLTGRFEHFGKAFQLGAEIARDERVKDAQPPVELVVRDAPSDPIATQASAREAVLDNGCVAILGPILSMPIVAAASVAESFRVPLLAPAVTESRLASIGGTVFSLDPSPRELARVLAEASVDGSGLKSFAVVTPDDARSSARVAEFTREAEKRGAKIAATIPYEAGKKDYRVALADAKKTPCDAVYILGEPADLEIFAKQIDGVKLGRPVLGHGEWADERLQGFGRASLDGSIVVLEEAENPASEFRRNLEAKVRERAGGELSRFHVYGYEAMSEVLAAVDQGARDADALIEILRGRNAWDTPSPGREVRAWTRQGGALLPFTDR
jgi:branched-chain amino acid transport system substrate-binding protein